jgi:hypothetical protein
MLERDKNGHLNPIEEIDGKWFFWDETWSNTHGPYENAVEANLALLEYCHTMLGEADVSIEP